MSYYRTKNMTFSASIRKALMAALATRPAAALWPTPKVRLSLQPGFAPTDADTVASLAANEATFTGYTAGGYTPTIVDNVNLGNQVVGSISSVVAEASGSAVGNSVYGYWLDDGVNVIGWESFGAAGPFNFGAAGDFLQVDLALPLDQIQSLVG